MSTKPSFQEMPAPCEDLNQIVAEHRQLFEALRDHEERSLVGLLEEHIVVDWHEETA